MVEIFNSMTDDQLAITGSIAAILFCGTLTSLSYYFGARRRHVEEPVRLKLSPGTEKVENCPVPATKRRAA